MSVLDAFHSLICAWFELRFASYRRFRPKLYLLSPYPDRTRRHYRKRMNQLSSVFADYCGHDSCLTIRRETCEPNEYNSGRNSPLPEYQFSEVIVCSYQYRVLLDSEIKHGLICQARPAFRDGADLVMLLSQSRYNLSVHALVGDKVHFADSLRG